MRPAHRLISAALLSFALGLGAPDASSVSALGRPPQGPGRELVSAADLAGIADIRALGLDPARSEVMALAEQLTDVYGPRLTGSPNLERAGKWAASKMREWKLDRAELEPWPPNSSTVGPNNGFPNGWFNEHFYMAATAPQPFPIAGVPLAWTSGTAKLVRGEAVIVTGVSQEAVAPFAGKLKGKWILGSTLTAVQPTFTPLGRRYTTEDLDRIEARGRGAGNSGAPVGPGRQSTPPTARGPATPAFNRNDFFKAEGALGVLSANSSGRGLYTASGAPPTRGPGGMLPIVAISAEQYGQLSRLVQQGAHVVIEADIRNRFVPNPPLFNVIGEIRGTDKADEVVMLGAHLDSWHASTGATDNAAGSAAVLEAMRLLKASGVTLRRTVRAALWTGEEQGLYGSAYYVRQHFGGARPSRGAPPTPVTPEHAKLSGYFNLDNGTGAIRGVYLQQNAAVEPIFRSWIEPLRDLGMTHLTLSNTSGTDHTSFTDAGLPGWEFIQDEIEYNALTHHTNFDSYERLIPEDLRKDATILAAFAYLAANRAELLPRP